MTIAGLILAAGQARRFGSDKRQALLPSGQTMLEAVLSRYASVFPTLLVVLPEQDDFGQALCTQFKATPVINTQADLGMGQSLAVGVAHLQGLPGITGVVVGLADMPAVTESVLRQIQAHLAQHGRAVVPCYQSQWGHPRGLPANLFAPLSTLTGDQGAKAVLDWHHADQLDVYCPGILFDADTPADLARLQRET